GVSSLQLLAAPDRVARRSPSRRRTVSRLAMSPGVLFDKRYLREYRNSEVVQRRQGLWLHPARGWRRRRFRAHLGSRACRLRQPERGPARRVRTRARQQRQDLGGEPEGRRLSRWLAAPYRTTERARFCRRRSGRRDASPFFAPAAT